MDTPLAFAPLFPFATLVLQLAWFWLLVLLRCGIQTYIGILIGWHVLSTSDSALLGFVVAALCVGPLGGALSRRLCRSAC